MVANSGIVNFSSGTIIALDLEFAPRLDSLIGKLLVATFDVTASFTVAHVRIIFQPVFSGRPDNPDGSSRGYRLRRSVRRHHVGADDRLMVYG